MSNGILFGCFSVLHYGHIRAIKYCLERCDNLTIGLFSDDAIAEFKERPSIEYRYRELLLQEIFPQVCIIKINKREETEFPKDKKYDILFASETHKNKLHMVSMETPIKKVFIPHTHNISSSKIKGWIRNGKVCN